MKTAFRPFLFLIPLLFASASNAALPFAVGDQALPSLAPMVKQASPAVVNIAVKSTASAQRTNPFMNDPFFGDLLKRQQPQRRRPTMSAGSGVIVDSANGYILTNHHVVENADEITVTLFDDRELSAVVVGSDASSDVAVLQVDSEKLSQIPYADSEALEVGDFVVAIGNPFGFSHTVTSGIVSGLGRYGLTAGSYENFIQTDAAINPGNSGGALLNLRGELIGINTAIVSRSGGNVGIGFAIPINMARSIMEQILEFGEVRRGLLGVSIRSVDQQIADTMDLAVEYGAMVYSVSPGSAAEKAGIQIDDVIVSVEGNRVKNALELRNAIGLRPAGEKVSIEYYREDQLRKVSAQLGSQNELSEGGLQGNNEALHPGLRGATFADLRDSRTSSDSEGVLVVDIDPNSAAAGYGLEQGDIITRVNRKRVASLEAFRNQVSGDGLLMLTVLRGSSLRLLRIG
ncbi:MAG: DegQ family serine endoprotease [Gammaproteobacteria bacterium]